MQTDEGDIRSGYDGLGRIITMFTDDVQDSTSNAGSTEEYYYNEAEQVLEVRKGTVSGGNKSIDPIRSSGRYGTTAKLTPR